MLAQLQRGNQSSLQEAPSTRQERIRQIIAPFFRPAAAVEREQGQQAEVIPQLPEATLVVTPTHTQDMDQENFPVQSTGKCSDCFSGVLNIFRLFCKGDAQPVGVPES